MTSFLPFFEAISRLSTPELLVLQRRVAGAALLCPSLPSEARSALDAWSRSAAELEEADARVEAARGELEAAERSLREVLALRGPEHAGSEPTLDPAQTSLLVRSRLSDRAFLGSLAEQVRPKLLAQEVDDVVQETCLAALSARSLPLRASEVEAWIRGIARHKVKDQQRARYCDAHGQDRPRKPPPEPTVAMSEVTRAALAAADASTDPRKALEDRLELWAILRLLPDEGWAREALGWATRRAAGESAEEIADAAGVGRRQVYQRLDRLAVAAEEGQRGRPRKPSTEPLPTCRTYLENRAHKNGVRPTI